MRGNGKDAAVGRVAGRKYWRAADAQVVVEAWRASGERLEVFAERYGVRPRRVRRWARQLGPKAQAAVTFHPVRLVGAARPVERKEPIEIVLSEEVRVRVPAGFCAEDLERVLGVLGGC
jgi:hypothetical protein